jgi:hypothetical protein
LPKPGIGRMPAGWSRRVPEITICATLVAVGSLTARAPGSVAKGESALTPVQLWQLTRFGKKFLAQRVACHRAFFWRGRGRRSQRRRQIGRSDRRHAAEVSHESVDVAGRQSGQTIVHCLAHGTGRSAMTERMALRPLPFRLAGRISSNRTRVRVGQRNHVRLVEHGCLQSEGCRESSAARRSACDLNGLDDVPSTSEVHGVVMQPSRRRTGRRTTARARDASAEGSSQ